MNEDRTGNNGTSRLQSTNELMPRINNFDVESFTALHRGSVTGTASGPI